MYIFLKMTLRNEFCSVKRIGCISITSRKHRENCTRNKRRAVCKLMDKQEYNAQQIRPKELGHSVKQLSGFRVTLQTDTGVSMTEISGLIDMLLKRMVVVVVIVMMIMMMAMIVMVIWMMIVVIVVVIREIIVRGWLAIRVPGSR